MQTPASLPSEIGPAQNSPAIFALTASADPGRAARFPRLLCGSWPAGGSSGTHSLRRSSLPAWLLGFPYSLELQSSLLCHNAYCLGRFVFKWMMFEVPL